MSASNHLASASNCDVATAQLPDGWGNPSTPPDVADGGYGFFWIAVQRHGSDKVFTFPAIYANGHVLRCSDFEEPCDCIGDYWSQVVVPEGNGDGDIAVSGWFNLKRNDEFDEFYQPVCSKGDVILAWHAGPDFITQTTG